jgi:tRNA/tmRNA/rRNA uracil-C5-methylase (TrmA/RlmC/RlmD family)
MNNPFTCPHFSLCSGCELADELFNPPIWKEALSFFHQFNIEPDLIADGFSQTRLKAKLAVRPGPQIGLFKKNSHEVISIPHCLVHHPSINRAVALIKEEILRHSIAPYQENPPRGLLRYLQLFVERATNRVQLSLVVTNPNLDTFCHSLLKHDLWHSIWLNLHPSPSNRIFSDSWHLVRGQPFLWQTLNQTPIAFHPGAFSQTHLPLFEKMLQKISSWVYPTDRVLELYAGVGAIGLTLQAAQITLVENNPFAHLSFQQTPKRPNITYHLLDAKEAPLSGHTLIIVDPPRKGLDPILLQKLCAHPSGRLIYISCGFESFKRDCEQLLSSNWKLKEAHGYLLFPGTNHVEILSYLEKAEM